ncbi:MAG TPA: DbpA RNA binding domain-containing protein, partial [Kofleriaceae bacterium]|nr:DbpA RNA binding domain-containing protein [Kofleriaceae bacterium]
LAAEVSDDDRAVARTLLASLPAEDLVATLVRLRREARPAPEELTLPPSMRPRRDDAGTRPEPRRPPRPRGHEARVHDAGTRRDDAGPHRDDAGTRPEPRHGAGPRRDPRHDAGPRPEPRHGAGSAWFTINVGRSKNADPKWLIPLLCRRGNITKREIGKIQIFMRETRVEIAPEAAPSFAEAVRRPDANDRHIHIEPLDTAL